MSGLVPTPPLMNPSYLDPSIGAGKGKKGLATIAAAEISTHHTDTREQPTSMYENRRNTNKMFLSHLITEVSLEGVDRLPGDAAVEATRVCGELSAVS